MNIFGAFITGIFLATGILLIIEGGKRHKKYLVLWKARKESYPFIGVGIFLIFVALALALAFMNEHLGLI